jgi:hypothetical protein
MSEARGSRSAPGLETSRYFSAKRYPISWSERVGTEAVRRTTAWRISSIRTRRAKTRRLPGDLSEADAGTVDLGPSLRTGLVAPMIATILRPWSPVWQLWRRSDVVPIAEGSWVFHPGELQFGGLSEPLWNVSTVVLRIKIADLGRNYALTSPTSIGSVVGSFEPPSGSSVTATASATFTDFFTTAGI